MLVLTHEISALSVTLSVKSAHFVVEVILLREYIELMRSMIIMSYLNGGLAMVVPAGIARIVKRVTLVHSPSDTWSVIGVDAVEIITERCT